MLLSTEWRPRALIRAQLIEAGFEVVATNNWPMMRCHLRPGMKPRLAMVDLLNLPEPANVLDDLRVLMKPERVLVLMAVGTLSAADVERRGFRSASRPIVIGDVVQMAASMIGSDRDDEPRQRTNARM